jgi:glycosyltransferase involved in cell wall biosynthesis
MERFKMQRQNSQVLVVIAALNEAEGIGPTVEELKKVLRNPHLVVVDGNSFDKTIEIARSMGAIVMLQKGKGKGNAMFQGLKQLCSNVQYVVFTDADYTYPAEYVPKMIEILEQNTDVGMVIGNRFDSKPNSNKSYNNPFYIGNRLLAFLTLLANGIRLGDPLSGLRVVRAKILKDWKPKSMGFDIEAELNSHVGNKGYEIVEIPIEYRSRLGEKKLRVRHGLGIAKRILAESLHL